MLMTIFSLMHHEEPDTMAFQKRELFFYQLPAWTDQLISPSPNERSSVLKKLIGLSVPVISPHMIIIIG